MQREMTIMLLAVPHFLDDIGQSGGLEDLDIANITDVSKATVSRWRSGEIKPIPRNELILSDLHDVVARLQPYYSPEEIRTWLHAQHPQLNGERAVDIIHQERTIEVLKIIDRLDSHAFV
jgi:transcriptional regulator with XRE-family HTH domain